MNKPNSEYGVITEQGFAVGKGLGFNPFDENMLNQDNNSDNTSDSKEDK